MIGRVQRRIDPGPVAEQLRRPRAAPAVTIALGTALLAVTLRVPRGSGWLVVLSIVVAVVWTAGALVSGPVHLGTGGGIRPRAVLSAVALGCGAALVFFAAYLVGREMPLVAPALRNLVGKAEAGSGLLVAVALVNGVAEEVFFRGALFDALRARRPVATTTVVYVLATAATGNIALVIAAAIMGSVLGLQRATTGTVLAPIITHVTWSAWMLLLLPRL